MLRSLLPGLAGMAAGFGILAVFLAITFYRLAERQDEYLDERLRSDPFVAFLERVTTENRTHYVVGCVDSERALGAWGPDELATALRLPQGEWTLAIQSQTGGDASAYVFLYDATRPSINPQGVAQREVSTERGKLLCFLPTRGRSIFP